MTDQASVIIPAYNEERVVGQCLDGLARELGRPDHQVDVVVVANGCVDATAEVARSYAARLDRLQVLDRPEPGKIGALNAGEAAVTAFPRIYLDADIVLEGGALGGLIDTLTTTEPVVAAPAVRFDTTGANWAVRAFYRVYCKMPYVTDGLIGLGVYGMSSAGRARFGEFPEVTADDLFVQEMFAPAERLRAPGWFVVRVPRRLTDLVSVRSRGAQGKVELAELGITPHTLDATAVSPARALVDLLRREPRRVVDVVIYVLVTMAARRRASRGLERWARDESTRNSAHTFGDK